MYHETEEGHHANEDAEDEHDLLSGPRGLNPNKLSAVISRSSQGEAQGLRVVCEERENSDLPLSQMPSHRGGQYQVGSVHHKIDDEPLLALSSTGCIRQPKQS